MLHVGGARPRVRVRSTAMRAYLLVDHGSRLEAANRVLEEVAAAFSSQLERGVKVAFAHQEAAAPSIEVAVASLARDGVTELVVIPFFLAPGKHATSDVPRLAREAAEKAGMTLEVLEPPLPEVPVELARLLVQSLRAR